MGVNAHREENRIIGWALDYQQLSKEDWKGSTTKVGEKIEKVMPWKPNEESQSSFFKMSYL